MSSSVLAHDWSTRLTCLRRFGCSTGSANVHTSPHTSWTSSGSEARAAVVRAFSSFPSASTRVSTIFFV